ncbi:GNAT family N-acetyltransferase [Paenibacillus sp. 7124]|uniref:GNAT family N-acetyltransferase n=1 Tax=Paenibacillus apii TaxID=1850370 RepID=A0A6M1PNL2_9BACL|nr:GNAT family N-acetyltransferase [Paenibacillus apii]NGM84786.1 GNAT family N-acetyltransferase [Paenibacillus apii]
MIIKFHQSSIENEYEIYPFISYESQCNDLDFPEPSFDPSSSFIFHTVKLVASLDLLTDEYDNSEEIIQRLKESYAIDEDKNLIDIAELHITEFPNEWKDEIGPNWFYWLDAIDGDHAVVGSRADEILDRELYDDPFDFGSLYYIQTLKVHKAFRGEKLGLQLINYAFEHFIKDYNGMVFLIPQEPITQEIESGKRKMKPIKLVNYYEKLGFKRVFNSINSDIVMEVEISKLRYRE